MLRLIPRVDLRLLDPVATNAYLARSHGFAVFNTLFGWDSSFAPQPADDGRRRNENVRFGLATGAAPQPDVSR